MLDLEHEIPVLLDAPGVYTAGYREGGKVVVYVVDDAGELLGRKAVDGPDDYIRTVRHYREMLDLWRTSVSIHAHVAPGRGKPAVISGRRQRFSGGGGLAVLR